MSASYSEQPSANLLPRLAAMGYDSLILLSLWILISAIHTVIFGAPENAKHNHLPVTLFPLLLASTYWFYRWFWTHGGQTIGMKAWRIKVVHEKLDDTPLTHIQCAIRMFVGLISLGCFGMGYLWVILSSSNDTWHDSASRTRTIRLPKPPKKH